MTPTLTPEARARMLRVWTLITGLLDAAGVAPSDQQVDVLFVQAVYEAPAATQQALVELVAAHAQIAAGYLTVDQAAQRLRVKPKLIRKLARLGALHGYRGGRGWQFSEQAIARFIERNEYMGDVRIEDLETWQRRA